MATGKLDLKDVSAVRVRLILTCRLITLHRGIDLSRMKRTVSVVNGRPFIKLRRKGWKVENWEQIIALPELPCLSPWHLIQHYVSVNRLHGNPGGPLLLSLSAPWKPLSANAINSLTKRLLKRYGVDTTFWKAHSTRGAGVSLYKKLGLPSEMVCEIGCWKMSKHFQHTI